MKCEEGNKLDLKNAANNFPFQQQNNYHSNDGYHEIRPPFHLHENSLINHRDAAETAIKIIAAKQSITDMVFCRYLKQRRIKKNIADKYCHEVVFKFRNKDAKHIAIGLKNSAGGYELRSENFKLSSSPKYVTYITSGKQNCDTKIDVANPNFDASDVLKRGAKIKTKIFLFIHQLSHSMML